MKPKKLQGIILAFLLSAVQCYSADISHTVFPGVGIFEDSKSESYVKIDETDDGFKTEFFLDAATTNDERPILTGFVGSWASEGWSRVFFDEVESTGAFQSIIEFNPFDEADTVISPLETGTQLNLPPSTIGRGRPYNLVAQVCDVFCGPGKLSLEYSVTMINAPLPGDFNYDSKVDVADFMILSGNFGADPNGLSWRDGDANLDRFVRFDDFLILSANFGMTEEQSEIASVPEPSAYGMLVWALCGMSIFRSSRRHPVTSSSNAACEKPLSARSFQVAIERGA